MFNYQTGTVPLSSKEAAQLAFDLPEEDVLIVTTNILRAAREHKNNPRRSVPYQNAVLLAYYLTARLAGAPVVVELDAAA